MSHPVFSACVAELVCPECPLRSVSEGEWEQVLQSGVKPDEFCDRLGHAIMTVAEVTDERDAAAPGVAELAVDGGSEETQQRVDDMDPDEVEAMLADYWPLEPDDTDLDALC